MPQENRTRHLAVTCFFLCHRLRHTIQVNNKPIFLSKEISKGINCREKKGRTFLIFRRNAEQQIYLYYTTKAQYNERRPNQERTGENRTGGRCKCAAAGVSPDRAAQSLQVLKVLKKREDAAAETGARSLRCALLSSLSPSFGACRTRALQSNGGGVGKKEEEQEEGRKREVSSINGLPFCSPARQIAFFFYRVFFGNSFRRCSDPVP